MASNKNGMGMKILWIPGRKRHDRKGMKINDSLIISQNPNWLLTFLFRDLCTNKQRSKQKLLASEKKSELVFRWSSRTEEINEHVSDQWIIIGPLSLQAEQENLWKFKYSCPKYSQTINFLVKIEFTKSGNNSKIMVTLIFIVLQLNVWVIWEFGND